MFDIIPIQTEEIENICPMCRKTCGRGNRCIEIHVDDMSYLLLSDDAFTCAGCKTADIGVKFFANLNAAATFITLIKKRWLEGEEVELRCISASSGKIVVVVLHNDEQSLIE